MAVQAKWLGMGLSTVVAAWPDSLPAGRRLREKMMTMAVNGQYQDADPFGGPGRGFCAGNGAAGSAAAAPESGGGATGAAR